MNTDLLTQYQTNHLPLAAYLSGKGCLIETVEHINGRGTFHFKFVPRTLISEYNNGIASVEPGAFALKMNQLIQVAKRQTYDGAN